MSISAIEILQSNLERRAAVTGDSFVYPRLADLSMILPAITGKVEMVYEGEQQGSEVVARKLLGEAVLKLFNERFPAVERAGRGAAPERQRRGYGELNFDDEGNFGAQERKKPASPKADASSSNPQVQGDADYDTIVEWFMQGNRITLSDEQPFEVYFSELSRVPALAETAKKFMQPRHDGELALGMEMILEALHQALRLSREDLDSTITFSELMKFNILRTVT